ncbi:MAG: hypothetical protein HZA00_07195 [Nitrospinae bacterium]|nr:hypothetical protein [Nitrospinota bacterium]
MSKKDIELFIKDLKTTPLRDFAVPVQSEPSLLYSGKSSQFNIDRFDIPVPELVQFLLGFILKLQIYGHGEKLQWEIPFNYKEFSCVFALQKFGLRLYIAGGEDQQSDVNKVSVKIIKKIQKAIHRVEKTLLIPFAEQQIKTGHVTIANQYHILMNRYIYFREKAEKASKQEKNSGTNNIEELTKSLNEMFRAKNELFYNTIAMLDAYFSFIEHLFVLVMPLYRNNVRLVEFIGSFWADKYKLLFDIKANLRAKSFYDELNTIKERFRNFYAHGGFEKGGASLYIHVPNIGAIPAQFSKVKNSPHFDFFPIQEDSFLNICKTIDDFDKWLRSEESGLRLAIRYAESGLDLQCNKQSLQKIRSAISSDESLEGLIEHYSHIWEMHANMDY